MSCFLCVVLAIALTLCYTRNSSGDEIANVNFLYDDIGTRTTKYNRLVHFATDRRGGYVWNACLPNSVK